MIEREERECEIVERVSASEVNARKKRERVCVYVRV